MSVGTAIAIYFVVWWIVLFAVLPWGVRSQEESGQVSKGTDPGAPAMLRLAPKLLWTTAVAAVVFILGYLIYAGRLIAIDKLASWLGQPG
jgi:predicted secreted protein